jgi:hypothetical protein
MFICDVCKEVSQPLEKKTTVPIETREKIYSGSGKLTGMGREIVREVAVCPRCVEKARG